MNGITYYEDGLPNKNALADMTSSLKWSLELNNDCLVNEIGQRLDLTIDADYRKYDVICPLDGPVDIVIAYSLRSEWTWKHRCGRFWLLGLCPHCLGLLGKHILALN